MLNYSAFLAFFLQFLFHSVLGQTIHTATFPPQSIQTYLAWQPNKKPIYSAHRGGPQPGYPENCLATLLQARKLGAEILEIDISMTQDSVLVLLHDHTLDRTTTGSGPIAEKTFEEIQNLTLVDKERSSTRYRIPTLNSVLSWAKGKVILSLDIKGNFPLQRVIEAVKSYGMENNAIIIAYNVETVKTIDRIAPELMISANIRNLKELGAVMNTGVSFSKIVAFTGTMASDEVLYKQIHDLGSTCIIGTMGNLDRQAKAKGVSVYHALIEKGIDIIAGDETALILEAIALYKNE